MVVIPYKKFLNLFNFCRLSSPIASTYSICSKHTLPDLPYDYNALEPHIATEIMKIHHSKHHATYVNNLNVAEEKMENARCASNTCILYLTVLHSNLPTCNSTSACNLFQNITILSSLQ